MAVVSQLIRYPGYPGAFLYPVLAEFGNMLGVPAMVGGLGMELEALGEGELAATGVVT